MRFCGEHWARLRQAIADRGLDGLVARSGEEARSNLVAELQGSPPVTTFDPLMAAHNAVLRNCLEVGGLAVMVSATGEQNVCPLCRMNELHQQECSTQNCTFSYDDWCEKAADDMQVAWREMNTGGAA